MAGMHNFLQTHLITEHFFWIQSILWEILLNTLSVVFCFVLFVFQLEWYSLQVIEKLSVIEEIKAFHHLPVPSGFWEVLVARPRFGIFVLLLAFLSFFPVEEASFAHMTTLSVGGMQRRRFPSYLLCVVVEKSFPGTFPANVFLDLTGQNLC